MNRSKAETIVARLMANAADLKYGSVSMTAKIHNGRITEVNYSTTESMKEAETKESEKVNDK